VLLVKTSGFRLLDKSPVLACSLDLPVLVRRLHPPQEAWHHRCEAVAHTRPQWLVFSSRVAELFHIVQGSLAYPNLSPTTPPLPTRLLVSMIPKKRVVVSATLATVFDGI